MNVCEGSFPDIHERLLSAKSRPSSKELICSVRPSLNDRFRLQAAVHILHNASYWTAEIGHKRPFAGYEKPGARPGSFESDSDAQYSGRV